jgi:alpha-D-ribose 1-methylphosphonate 5-triphosphate synthase subunit PhnL
MCLYGSFQTDASTLRLRRDDGTAVESAQAEPSAWLDLRRREKAYVSQFLRVVPRLPALDVVAERQVGARTGATVAHDALLDAARENAQRLLARLNLPQGLWSLPPANISGGEQQRVNIAHGVIEPASLLLLDEPTASLGH